MIHFLRYYKPHWKLLVLDLFSAIMISLIDLYYPMVTRDLINNIIPNNQYNLIYQAGAILLVLFIIRMFFGRYSHKDGENRKWANRA